MPARVSADALRLLRLIVDTPVAPGAASLWTVDPFRGLEHDGLLFGLGACDTKGGLATQLTAAQTLATRRDWSGELVVQAVADEEDGSRLGFEHLLRLGLLSADGAIVAEPTNCAPSLAQLGTNARCTNLT